MADRFPGHISIGGKVARKHVKALCQAIAESGAGPDYGMGGWEPDDENALLVAASNCGGTLDLMDDEACYGQFEELEQFLIRHGIAFDRHSDAKYEYDAERIMFRPGMKEPKGFGTTNADDVVVRAEDVMKVVTDMERFGTLPKATLNDVVARFKTLCGEDVPALEDFEIV